ncbi:MAG: class I SAM-dependent methyltransferase [Pseudomonadota bacterium]
MSETDEVAQNPGLPGPTAWQGAMGQKWARHLEAMEAQCAIGLTLGLAALAPVRGERVLDIGCGGARTTRAIAEAVGAEGRVLGLDISPDLVPEARAHLSGLAQAEVMLADAGAHPLEPGGWDAIFSRFGVMFFDDPPATFRALHGALRQGGRAVMVVHGARGASPWAMLPMAAAAEVLGPPEPSPPGAPGPFGWESPEIFVPILEAGGFAEIGWETHAVEMPMGVGLAEDPVEAALLLIRQLGSVARWLATMEEAAADRAWTEIAERLRPALAAKVQDGAVSLGGQLHVITARA